VRIPLDYYRILGVPIQATSRQITQSYQDRRLQMPRREYSDLAITARQELLDQAYAELSNPEKRTKYNSQFLKNYELTLPNSDNRDLSNTETLPEGTPWLEINEDQLLGALLILQELGEYELVLRLGDSYLINESKSELTPEEKTIRNDIILTIALGCLELGREQWQQREYENAVASGKAGQELLLREGLFPLIQAEIQTDLYKLRPYRILELLAISDQNFANRRKGIRLLQEMLQERGGIEGLGDDKSGLNIDDFLRFIQQLRSYLTVAEQQELFEFEAKRPSAVATYLAVYALLARGFAEKKPELIVRAKKLLIFLAKKQDVHLEQAICALLLGQTEEAGQALELSQEYESIVFIRANSQGDSDLLHGLCLYTERWLENEVFLHFKDLIDREVSLVEYFADIRVQNYLEKLPGEYELETNLDRINQFNRPQQTITSISNSNPELVVQNEQLNSHQTPEEVSSLTTSFSASKKHHNPLQKLVLWLINKIENSSVARHTPSRKKIKKRRHKSKKIPLIIIPLVGLAGSFVLGYFLFTRNTNNSRSSDAEPLALSLNQPPIPIPLPETELDLPSGELNLDTAQEIVQAWLDAKARAFGKEHKIDSLTTILAEPILSVQRNRAKTVETQKAYFLYEHQVQVKKVEVNEQNSEQAIIEAEVMENASYYQGEQRIDNKSYNSNLLVRYDLVLVNNKWLIKNLKLLN
jgi:curved DNA-binding protein CbpA